MPTMKRPAAAPSAAQKRAKVVEVDPVQLHCDAIGEGLCRSAEIPTSVLNMLSAMTESALRSCKEERHKYQESVVDMIGTVLAGIEADCGKTIAALKERLAGTDQTRAERESAVKSAQDDLEQKKATTNQNKHALADDAQAFKTAKDGVSTAQAAVKKAEKDGDLFVKEKERLEKIVVDFFRPLAQGGCGEDVPRLVESLQASVQKLGLDESMLTALPEAIGKEPATRGMFDKSVISALEEELNKRIAEKKTSIEGSEPAKVDCAEKLKVAEASFEAAKAKQHESAEAYNNARNAQKDAENAVKLAQQVLADLDPEVKKLEKELAFAEKDLQDFCHGPKSSFGELRDRVLPPAPAEAAEEEEKPEADAEVAGATAEGVAVEAEA
eukprot:gb/GFBE01060046.1/.p1 GENE.gb/GFBE01060046.1/~~gb/GFBE01060046.1/.p1  ORF type:complete len:384 (+),score=139.63 gb/GFBE01060046.1/:1-1152(+)